MKVNITKYLMIQIATSLTEPTRTTFCEEPGEIATSSELRFITVIQIAKIIGADFIKTKTKKPVGADFGKN